MLEEVESYLNDLVSEYEDKRRLVDHAVDETTLGDERPDDDARRAPAVAELTVLGGFLGPDSDLFQDGTSTNIDDVVKRLRAALLEPLEIPPLKLSKPRPE